MAVDGEKLRPLNKKQRKALEAFAVSGRVPVAASAAGVTTKTIYQWMSQPEFSAALDSLEDTSIRFLSNRLTAMAEDAVRAIEDGLKEDQPMRDRMQAAGLYFGQLLRLREMITQDQRIAELERRLDDVNAID